MTTRRYEGVERGKRRFYEIAVEGFMVVTTSGLLESTRKPTKTTDEWASADDAKRAVELFIAQKVNAGFKEVTTPKAKKAAPPKLDFDRAILANRDDPAPWLVYADALQAAGDPRGELIVVQEARARAPKDKALVKAEDKLLDAHYRAFVGDALLDCLEERTVEVTWKNGFFDTASVREPFDGGWEDEPADPPTTLTVFDSPSARFLDALTIESRHAPAFQELTARIADAPQRPPLRSFTLKSKGASRPGTVDAERLLAAFPELRTLSLDAIVERLAPTPKLRELTLQVATTDTLTPLLADANLEHLGVRHLEGADAFVERLVKSPLYPRLTSLALFSGDLTPLGAARLAKAKRPKKLIALEVGGNRLDKRAIALLAAISDQVWAAGQR